MLEFLIGARLVTADDAGFEVVASNDKRYRFNFESYERRLLWIQYNKF